MGYEREKVTVSTKMKDQETAWEIHFTVLSKVSPTSARLMPQCKHVGESKQGNDREGESREPATAQVFAAVCGGKVSKLAQNEPTQAPAAA